MKIRLALGLSILLAAAGCTQQPSPEQSQDNTQTNEIKDQANASKPEEKKQPGPKKENVIYGPSKPKYKMDLAYNGQKHTISGTMTVKFTNNLNKKLQHVYFNLWPNAEVFQKNGGSLKVSHVKVNGKKATYQVKKTKLDISGLSLKRGSQATVQMNIKVAIPHHPDRFGWYKSTVSLGNWFPILAVYDSEGWNLDPYFGHGESFYSLNGDFDVTFTADKSVVVAATGTEIGKPKVKNGKATHHFKAHKVRDFAMELDKDYLVKSTTFDNVKINVYYDEEHAEYAEGMLWTGKKTLQLFGEKFGEYPWPELDIVTMKAWFGGMEYPQLVMISFPDKKLTQGFVNYVTAHEIGHQWFYGIIGNNEYDDPWLDESFAEFAAQLFSHRLDRLEAKPPRKDYYHLSSPIPTFVKHADEGGLDAYAYTDYAYGPSVLNELRELLGDEQFYKSMRQYFEAKKFKITTTASFICIMEETSGLDLTNFFKDHRVYLTDER